MKRRKSPLTIILFILGIIVAFVIAFIVKAAFGNQLGNFSLLVFIITFSLVGGIFSFFIGRFIH